MVLDEVVSWPHEMLKGQQGNNNERLQIQRVWLGCYSIMVLAIAWLELLIRFTCSDGVNDNGVDARPEHSLSHTSLGSFYSSVDVQWSTAGKRHVLHRGLNLYHSRSLL